MSSGKRTRAAVAAATATATADSDVESSDGEGDERPACKYGTACFRKNPDHFKEFSHPHLHKKQKVDASPTASPVKAPAAPAAAAAAAAVKPAPVAVASPPAAAAAVLPPAADRASSWGGDGDGDDDDGTASASSSSSAAAAAAAVCPSSPVVAAATSSLPPCPYGMSCFRKNLTHFAEYSHPIKGPVSATANGGSSSSSSSSAAAAGAASASSAAAAAGADAAPSSGTLQRSYSSMSEAERKLLVLNALQQKEKLEAALKAKETEMAAKQEEFSNLQAELAAGMMLIPGEKEALEGDEVKSFMLRPSRTHEANAASMHFRLCESQFYRLLAPGQNIKVSAVEYIVAPKVRRAFDEAAKKIKGVSKPVLAFHGTADKNIKPITETGFRMPGVGGHKHATDTGWFGKGVYFSEFASYAMGYIKGSTALLMCQVLLGRVFKCTKLIHGAPLQKGYDSHSSPCGNELVVFNPVHILPCYIVHFQSGVAGFKYEPAADPLLAVTSSDTKGGAGSGKANLEAAVAHKKSKALADYAFALVGKYAAAQSVLKQLIADHGGQLLSAARDLPAKGRALLLLCSDKEFEQNRDTKGHKIASVRATVCAIPPGMAAAAPGAGKGLVVQQTFLWDKIVDPAKTNIDDYLLS